MTEFIDLITERPKPFRIGNERLFLYPMTLGKMMIMSGIIKELSINITALKIDEYKESLKVVKEKKDTVALFLAYTSLKDRDDIFDNYVVNKRRELISTLSDEEMATLFILSLSGNELEEFIKKYEIDKEREQIAKIAAIKKKNSNSVSFGAKSILGSFIIPACEKLNMTPIQVIWEISYAFLQALIADAENSMYLTDDEMKQAHVSQKKLDASDPKNAQEIMSLINN